MLNFANLNDVEFEYLCQDVLSKKLKANFRRFAPGKDGGIDLKDDSSDAIAQVKHYMNSSVSQLIASLANEIPKVKGYDPSKYYICCSKKLSPQKVDQIYHMFSEYMDSSANILTLTEIEDFLVDPENIDVLRKHYKLWISSTGILEDILTNDIFVDCESLLANIEDEEKFFVQTSAYDCALDCLSKSRCLLITGNPGVGKTVTSKMLVLYFATQGYRVRYTTDGNNISALKRSLSPDPNAKEIILLDDCLGQAYFNMKESQGNEILSIIRHIKFHKNKILILNSRVTIYQEAREQTPELVKSFDTNEYRVLMINMDKISDLEKAKILYNHLSFNKIDQPYFEEIKKDKRYLQIIRHKNYNPRIIDYVTNPYRISNIPVNEYFLFILHNLDYPSKAWDDEYIRRLTPVDRILLTTLYSITNTNAPYDFVRACFEKRISSTIGIDLSLPNFTLSIKHLQKSFIKITDVNNIKMLSVSNPSVNDFLSAHLSENAAETQSMLMMCYSVRQYKRLLNEKNFSKKMSEVFDNASILEYIFESSKQKCGYIAYYVSLHKIYNEQYRPYIIEYLSNADFVDVYEKNPISTASIVQKILVPEMVRFYKLDELLFNFMWLNSLLETFDLEDLIYIISFIDCLYTGGIRKTFLQSCNQAINDAIAWYCNDIDIEDFDIDISAIIEDCTDIYEYGPEIDTDAVADVVVNLVSDKVSEYINELLSNLPKDVMPKSPSVEIPCIDVSGVDDFIDSYIKSSYDDGIDLQYNYSDVNDSTEIDTIFNR